MQLMFGAQQYDYGVFSLDGGSLYLKGFDIGNVHIPLIRIITIVSAFALMVVLWLLVTRTRTGKAMRATSFDREAAAMMGIDIDRVIVFTFVHRIGPRGRGGRDVRTARADGLRRSASSSASRASPPP